jgi:geranylgeranyl diphosphate synthase type I
MIPDPLGFAAHAHRSPHVRHGWSRALHLAPDLYPGVGGKRFRASLLRWAYHLAGGTGDAPAALIDAVEMLHAGSLVIDDFEDDSLTRRGQPALHRVIGPARAVNAGNWMYFRALELAAGVYGPSGRSAALLTRFIEVARRCHEGQSIDLATRVDEVTPRQAQATALVISRWKTGRLVSLAAWCGAHAASGDSQVLRAVAAFGCRVGICLQMRNDLDELLALADGGDRSDDLRNRRVTWPWAWAAGGLPTRRFAALQRCLRQLPPHQPAAFRPLAGQLLDAGHARAVAAIDTRLERALDRLSAAAGSTLGIDPPAGLFDALRVVPAPAAAETTP